MPPQSAKTDPYASIAEDPYAGLAEGDTAPQPGLTKEQAAKTQPELSPERRYQNSGPITRFASSFDSNIGIPLSVQANPREGAQGLKSAVLHPGLEYESLKQMFNDLVENQHQLSVRAGQEWHMPGLAPKFTGFVHDMYSLIPVAGPAIVSALDKYMSGDKAGGLGAMTAILAQAKGGSESIAREGAAGEMAQIGEIKPSLKERATAPLKEKATSVGRTMTLAKSKTTQAVKGAIEKQTEDLEKNKQARTETVQKNLERDRQARYSIERKKIQAEAANKKITAENAEQAQQVAQRKQLAVEVDQGSFDLGHDIDHLENAVYKESNRRFDAVKSKVGNATEKPDALIAKVKSAETDILQDIPENVKEFKRIVQMEATSPAALKLRNDTMVAYGYDPADYDSLPPQAKQMVDDAIQSVGGGPPKSEDLTWDKLQSIKSRIDARLRNSQNMNGDLKRALREVRDSVVDEMGKMAVAHGAAADWTAARDFYRQWKEDFHESTGPSGSGSPVAQAFNAVDAKNIRQPFQRTRYAKAGSPSSNRGSDILRKYPQFGGDQIAARVDSLLTKNDQMNALPEKIKPAPLKEVAGATPLPKSKAAPPIPGKPTVNIREISARQIQTVADQLGRLNAWDARIIAGSVISIAVAPWIGIERGIMAGSAFVATKEVLSSYFNREQVINWLANPSPKEIESLNELPGIDKINVAHGLTEAAIEIHRRTNKPVKLSPSVRQFLGQGNIQRLLTLGATTSGAVGKAPIPVTRKPKKPGEQLRDLRQITSNPNLPAGEPQ